MTRHHDAHVRTVVRRLRPSGASIAAAAAVYDPGLLLHVQAEQHELAESVPAGGRHHGADVEQSDSGIPTVSP